MERGTCPRFSGISDDKCLDHPRFRRLRQLGDHGDIATARLGNVERRGRRDPGPMGARQLKRTYSKSLGWPLIPFAGGAIQLANLPGSVTPCMSAAT